MGLNLKGIGERAYISRVSKHLAQKHVSSAIGIAQSTYSNFEARDYEISIIEIDKLCDVLGISLLWLVYGEQDDSDNV